MNSRWSKMTDAEKKAYYAARKARRAKVAKAKDAKAEAKPEAAKKPKPEKTSPRAAKRKAEKEAAKAMTPEERLLKAVGVEPPRYCDNELALGCAIHGFRKALRAQANKVAEECKKIIDAVANVMTEFDHRVDGVAITYRDVEEKDIVMAKKPKNTSPRAAKRRTEKKAAKRRKEKKAAKAKK